MDSRFAFRVRAGLVRFGGWLPAAVIGLSGCSILEPIPKSDGQGYFGMGGAAKAEPGTAPTTPPAQPTCTNGAVASNAACFADGLGLAMDRQETKRRELLGMAREVVHTQASFNALLYPFGAVAVYEKLRGAPNSNLLLPAVAGTAAYGFLGSGIPEREKQYLQTAMELQCSLAWHGQWLYLDRNVTGHGSTTTEEETVTLERFAKRNSDRTVQTTSTYRQRLVSGSLEDVTMDLADKLKIFQSERNVLLGKLKGKPGSGAPAGALERVKGGNGTSGKNTTGAVDQRLRQQATLVRATLKGLESLRGEIASAAFRLTADADVIHGDLQRRLTDKLPALKDPHVVARELLDPNKSLAAKAEADEDAAGVMDSTMPSEALSGLSDTSRTAVASFGKKEGAGLETAWAVADAWLVKQSHRQAQALRAVKSMPCADSTLVQAGQTALPKVTLDRQGGNGNGTVKKTNGVNTSPLPPG